VRMPCFSGEPPAPCLSLRKLKDMSFRGAPPNGSHPRRTPRPIRARLLRASRCLCVTGRRPITKEPYMAHHPRLLTFLSAFLLAGVTSFGEKADHIQWNVSLEPVSVSPSSKVLARMTGSSIPDGISILSTLGAIPTTIHLEPNPAVASYRVLRITKRPASRSLASLFQTPENAPS